MRYYRKKLQWKAASAECKKSGMRLVTVDSADTAYWLRQQLIAGTMYSFDGFIFFYRGEVIGMAT